MSHQVVHRQVLLQQLQTLQLTLLRSHLHFQFTLSQRDIVVCVGYEVNVFWEVLLQLLQALLVNLQPPLELILIVVVQSDVALQH